MQNGEATQVVSNKTPCTYSSDDPGTLLGVKYPEESRVDAHAESYTAVAITAHTWGQPRRPLAGDG